MKLGVHLYSSGGPIAADNLIAQARAADSQAFGGGLGGDQGHAARRRVPTLDASREHAIVGDPDECLRAFVEMERRGQNYLFTISRDAAHQERVARLLFPRLA